eukprot:g5881.t1
MSTPAPKVKARAPAKKVAAPKPPGDVDTLVLARGKFVQKTSATELRYTPDEGKAYGPFSVFLRGASDNPAGGDVQDVVNDIMAHWVAPQLQDHKDSSTTPTAARNVCLLLSGDEGFKATLFGENMPLLVKLSQALNEDEAKQQLKVPIPMGVCLFNLNLKMFSWKVGIVRAAPDNSLYDLLDGHATLPLEPGEFDAKVGHLHSTAKTIGNLDEEKLRSFFAVTHKKPDLCSTMLYYFRTGKRLVTVVDYNSGDGQGGDASRYVPEGPKAAAAFKLRGMQTQQYLLFGTEPTPTGPLGANALLLALKAALTLGSNGTGKKDDPCAKTGMLFCVDGNTQLCITTLEAARCLVEARASETPSKDVLMFADALNMEISRAGLSSSSTVVGGDGAGSERMSFTEQTSAGQQRKSLLYTDGDTASSFSISEGTDLMRKMRELRAEPELCKTLLNAPRVLLFEGYVRAAKLEKELEEKSAELGEALEHENELHEASHHMSDMLLKTTDELEAAKKQLAEMRSSQKKMMAEVMQLKSERNEIMKLLEERETKMEQLVEEATGYVQKLALNPS